MILKKEQEVYAKFYNYAVECAKKGDYETARKALVCAISTLMRIADMVNEENKRVFLNKITTLIDKCSKISENDFDSLYGELHSISLEFDAFSEVVDVEICKKTSHALDEVAGLYEVKDEIQRRIINPHKYPDIYKRFNKKSGGGILLYGLPGTGKTMIVKALAKDINAKFVAVKCSDLLSKYFGESEENLKKLFDSARNYERAIIFFDEFEAIGSKRTGNNDVAMNRLVPELLTQMQGFDNNNTNLVVIAATNRPWDIDSAFLRPGRFGQKIYVSLPDKEARLKIINDTFKDVPRAEDFDADRIVELTECYSGADVNEVCECAKLFAIDREIESHQPAEVTMGDMMDALQTIRSSIVPQDIERMSAYRNIITNAGNETA